MTSKMIFPIFDRFQALFVKFPKFSKVRTEFNDESTSFSLRFSEILIFLSFWLKKCLENTQKAKNIHFVDFLHMKSMCIAVQLSKFFFHYSQFHNERLLEKSQTPERFEPAASR